MTDFWLTTLTGVAVILGACLSVVVISLLIVWRSRPREAPWWTQFPILPVDSTRPGEVIAVSFDGDGKLIDAARISNIDFQPWQWPVFRSAFPYDHERDGL